MTQTLTRSYDTFEDARNVVLRLEREGVTSDAISLIGRQETGEDRTVDGAAIGGAAGAAAGLLAGLGLIAIPGIGPVVAAGWLAATMTGAGAGALAGGVIGALTEAGFSRSEADRHARTIERGGSIVTVRVPQPDAPRIAAILNAAGPVPASVEGTPTSTLR